MGDFPTLGHREYRGRRRGRGVATRLPEGLRGAHGGIRGGSYVIFYLEGDWVGGREYMVFNETYEILQENLGNLCSA